MNDPSKPIDECWVCDSTNVLIDYDGHWYCSSCYWELSVELGLPEDYS